MFGSVIGFLGGCATDFAISAAGKGLAAGVTSKALKGVIRVGAGGMGLVLGQVVEDGWNRFTEECRCQLEDAVGLEIVNR